MGEVFAGRYELIDPIASGGMGTVWRVLDRTDGQLKAAKMLHQSDAAMLLRFVREQSLRIDHTHIVTPQSWAGVDDRVLFTMPLVAGGSVSMLIRQYGALPPRWIGRLVDQTLQALEAVHAAGIVHRDVKPGNLLLEPTGRGVPHLRLGDFGIAVPTDEARLTHIAMVIGTPGYMPPEQQLGADPDPSADIYALGMVILEMLTATKPPARRGAGRVDGPAHGRPRTGRGHRPDRDGFGVRRRGPAERHRAPHPPGAAAAAGAAARPGRPDHRHRRLPADARAADGGTEPRATTPYPPPTAGPGSATMPPRLRLLRRHRRAPRRRRSTSRSPRAGPGRRPGSAAVADRRPARPRGQRLAADRLARSHSAAATQHSQAGDADAETHRAARAPPRVAVVVASPSGVNGLPDATAENSPSPTR